MLSVLAYGSTYSPVWPEIAVPGRGGIGTPYWFAKVGFSIELLGIYRLLYPAALFDPKTSLSDNACSPPNVRSCGGGAKSGSFGGYLALSAASCCWRCCSCSSATRCCFFVSLCPPETLLAPFIGSPDFARRKNPRLVRRGGSGFPLPSGIAGRAVSSGDGDFSDVRGRKIADEVTIVMAGELLLRSRYKRAETSGSQGRSRVEVVLLTNGA